MKYYYISYIEPMDSKWGTTLAAVYENETIGDIIIKFENNKRIITNIFELSDVDYKKIHNAKKK